MEKLVVIIDDEPEYGKRLALYLNSNRNFPYRAVVFLNAEEAKNYIKGEAAYAVLAAEQTEKEVLELTVGTGVNLFWLSETERNRPFSVYRYDSAKKIMRKLTEQRQVREKIPVIGFFSPAGGSGAEVLSRNIAEELGKNGKVLYFPVFPFGVCGREGIDGLSEAFYFVRQKEEGKVLRLQELLQYGEFADAIGPVRWYTDLDSVTKEDMEALLQGGVWDTKYRAFVVAVGQFDRAGRAILSCCDGVLAPVWETADGKRLQEEFRRQLKESGETKLVSGMLEFPVREALSQSLEEAIEIAVRKGEEIIAGNSGGGT